jgi:hypothetical protein
MQKRLIPRRKTMIISDLNYLEANEDEVFGGFGIVPNRNSFESSVINFVERFDINKVVRSDARVEGNLSAGQSSVVGFNNSLTQGTSYVAPGLNSTTTIAAGN